MTHANGWVPAAYMSYTSQIFRLFLLSVLFVLSVTFTRSVVCCSAYRVNPFYLFVFSCSCKRDHFSRWAGYFQFAERTCTRRDCWMSDAHCSPSWRWITMFSRDAEVKARWGCDLGEVRRGRGREGWDYERCDNVIRLNRKLEVVEGFKYAGNWFGKCCVD